MTQQHQSPSEDFVKVFRAGIGGIRAKCELCGRKFFEDSEIAGDWEDGELEKLRERAAIDDKVVAMDNVSLGRIDGKEFVMGCPCLPQNLRKYEDFIWAHRRQFFEYVQARVKSLVEKILQDEADAEQTWDSLEQEQRAEEKKKCLCCRREVSAIGFDEQKERCVVCTDKINRLMEKARTEGNRGNYVILSKKIEELGEEPPPFCEPPDDDLDLPF
jgi:hypothetical protein